ncbi:MAG: hypothetical protein ACRDWT_08625 [Jatrophihabitantaceae bacterium]
MTVLIEQQLPGATAEVVLELGAQVGVEFDPPIGLIVHVVCAAPDGMRIVDVLAQRAGLAAVPADPAGPSIGCGARPIRGQRPAATSVHRLDRRATERRELINRPRLAL